MTFLDRRNFLKGAGVAVVGALTARTLPAAEPKAPRLRVAQLGVEHPHAPGKWETLQRRTDLFDCAGVWEPDPAVRKQVESHPTFRSAHWLTESELFGDTGIQAVLVERELPDLLGTAHRCLERGWHVHIDKPPGADLDGLRSLQTLAATKRLVLQMGYMWRYHPAFTFCFDVLHRGVLGRVVEVTGHLGKMMPASRRPQLAQMYHGSMMALGSHLLDLAVAVKGVPQHVSAFRRRTYPEHDAFYDNELAVLEYPDALATVRSMLTEVGGAQRRQFTIFGDEGTVEVLPIEPARVYLTLRQPVAGFKAGRQEIAIPKVKGRYDGMLEDFARMVRGQASVLTGFTPEHDLTVQRIALQFY